MDHILGVSISNRSVFATLVESRSDGPVVLRTFSRPRSTADLDYSMDEGSHEFTSTPEQPTDPGIFLTTGKEDDPSLFLSSEFGLADEKGESHRAEPASGDMKPAGIRTQTVEIELKEILAECAEAGYPEVRVVLCASSSDLAIHEVVLAEAEKKSDGDESVNGKKDRKAAIGFGARRRGAGDRDRLLRHLSKLVEQRFDPEQAFFLPMTPNEAGKRRVLGLFGREAEPIVPTLERFVDRGRRMPRFSLIDTEVSLLLGLVRLTLPPEGAATSRRLAIRVGAEDTLVMFLEGSNIRHFETLRSITRYDPPETIGSRILLLQDEYGLGEADAILVIGDGNETDLVELLAEFFPDSAVGSLRAVLPPYVDEFEADDSREAALAAAVALRGLSDPQGRLTFEPVNLLPKRLAKRRKLDVPIAWQNYAMLALLFASTLFFVARYLQQRHDITVARDRLEQQYKPEAVKNSKRTLDARRDSLFAVISQYDEALEVLDSLLYGSDRWSRAMEHTAGNAAAVSGVWIEDWSEQDGQIVMSGTATDRNQIVRLAARMDGVISSMTFSSIRDWPVFSYRMSVPLNKDLPEAVHYLREQVQLGLQVPVTEADMDALDSNAQGRSAGTTTASTSSSTQKSTS